MNKVIRLLKDKEVPEIKKIAESIKEAVDGFKPYVPMAVAMRTEGMKERHWEAISNVVGFTVQPYEGFTFQNCIDMNLHKYTDEICEIGERAGKEYNIETSLARMKREWEDIAMGTKPFRSSGTCTVTGFDDGQNILDEHMTLTQTLLFSPFKKPFEEELEEWNANLLYVSNALEEWSKCQKQWQYLQPIFDSPDIMKQLPGEAKRFKSVDRSWREIIKGTIAEPNTLRTCLRDEKTMLARLEQMNIDLDRVQKGLRDYLEAKRSVFARFYFLSNDDLLEILSQTKDVEKVQSHLRKVFENMVKLEFQPDKTITGMYSGENEFIKTSYAVDPKDKKVEDWMGEVENMMFDTIRDVLKFSVDDYLKRGRNDWIMTHPGQCVLNGSQVHWTQDLENKLAKDGKQGVKDYFEFCETQLLETVSLVRQKLSKLQSLTLNALIVIDVHARDVIGRLIQNEVEDKNHF
jgi:dynein heavy chain